MDGGYTNNLPGKYLPLMETLLTDREAGHRGRHRCCQSFLPPLPGSALARISIATPTGVSAALEPPHG